MSKLNPLGQSMAGLFAPDRVKKAGTPAPAANQTAGGPVRVPGGGMAPSPSSEAQDSLGNPNSPGYEFWGKKKPTEDELKAAAAADDKARLVKEASYEGPEIIRLSAGWEKLLVAQRKICEKAKNLFTKQEGSWRYSSHRMGKMGLRKSRGCILDVDSQEHNPNAKQDKKKDVA